MRKLIQLSIVTILVALTLGCQNKRTYCGKVFEKYLLHKNNGGTHNIVFYCDSTRKFINVSVTADTYVNTGIGDKICFKLTDYQVSK